MPAWESVKREEDADRVERDEAGDAGVEEPDQERGDQGQHRDPAGEHEAAAPVGELARQVPVRGLQGREPRELGVGGVGGHRQDQRRRPDRRQVQAGPGRRRRRGRAGRSPSRAPTARRRSGRPGS